MGGNHPLFCPFFLLFLLFFPSCHPANKTTGERCGEQDGTENKPFGFSSFLSLFLVFLQTKGKYGIFSSSFSLLFRSSVIVLVCYRIGAYCPVTMLGSFFLYRCILLSGKGAGVMVVGREIEVTFLRVTVWSSIRPRFLSYYVFPSGGGL